MEKIDKQYFDVMYAASDDPWNFSESAYESEKYRHTVAALAGKQFINGLEIGCSIGVLTGLLAKHCTSMMGVDISEKPIAIARERLKETGGIQFEVLDIPHEYPDHQFDLIVVSEVAYYLSKEDLQLSRELILDSLTEGGTLCLVHWRPQIAGCVFNGDEVSSYFLEVPGYTQTYQHINEQYRIDVIEKPLSAAAADLHND